MFVFVICCFWFFFVFLFVFFPHRDFFLQMLVFFQMFQALKTRTKSIFDEISFDSLNFTFLSHYCEIFLSKNFEPCTCSKYPQNIVVWLVILFVALNVNHVSTVFALIFVMKNKMLCAHFMDLYVIQFIHEPTVQLGTW